MSPAASPSSAANWKNETREFVAESLAYFERAKKTIGSGASSTPRASQRPAPLIADRAENAHIYDITGKRFIDYACGYGPLLLGHSPKPVLDAVRDEMARGMRTANMHLGEAEMGELVAETIPCAEVTCPTNSGSEAAQIALRMARALTGRNKVLKFRGLYHGWIDTIHVSGGIGNDGPDSIGQDPGAASAVFSVDWGDIDAVRRTLDRDFAAVILEPTRVSGGCFAPPAGFLEALRDLTNRLGIVLIFDEVVTGYRLGLGGAQQMLGVTPDMSIIGKAMAAGFPIGALTGTRAAMEPIVSGRLRHRGTFNGNPVSVGAAIACIRHLQANGDVLYPRMEAQGAELQAFMKAEAKSAGVPLSVSRIGSALQVYMGTDRVETLADLRKVDQQATLDFCGDLLVNGVQLLPRGQMYLSTVLTDADIADTRTAISAAVAEAARRAVA